MILEFGFITRLTCARSCHAQCCAWPLHLRQNEAVIIKDTTDASSVALPPGVQKLQQLCETCIFATLEEQFHVSLNCPKQTWLILPGSPEAERLANQQQHN